MANDPVRLQHLLKEAVDIMSTAQLDALICNMRLVDHDAAWRYVTLLKKQLSSVEDALENHALKQRQAMEGQQ
jgi:hypothetical protein